MVQDLELPADVDSPGPIHLALAGLCFQPAAKLTILLGDMRGLSGPFTGTM